MESRGGGGKERKESSPLNSFLRKYWKLCRPLGSRISSLKLKAHRSTRILVGTSTLQGRREVNCNNPPWEIGAVLGAGLGGSDGHQPPPTGVRSLANAVTYSRFCFTLQPLHRHNPSSHLPGSAASNKPPRREGGPPWGALCQ